MILEDPVEVMKYYISMPHILSALGLVSSDFMNLCT
jgi:hypothetical protein